MAKARRRKGPTPRSKLAPAPRRGPSRRTAVIVGVLVLAVLAALAAVLLLRGGEEEASSAPPNVGSLADCADAASQADARGCYIDGLAAEVDAAADPAAAVAAIADEVRASGDGFLISNCHGFMHTVGREYATEHGLTLATLMDSLPQTNDAGCAAGFAHGLVTGVAPQIDLSDPEAAAAVCGGSETRYQRYSCVHGFGHAFMRLSNEELPAALALCGKLGDVGADCAQGVYHDYWFAVAGLDSAEAPADAETDPRVLCAEQPDAFVRQCWYRAFIENRPPGAVDQAADLGSLCLELEGLQRESCITAASVVGPADPRAQLVLCSGLRGTDATACIRGIKVQNFLEGDTATYLDLIRRCDVFAGATGRFCNRWLGKVIAVVTDGEFAEEGCPQLEGAAEDACRAGARSYEDPLVTFS